MKENVKDKVATAVIVLFFVGLIGGATFAVVYGTWLQNITPVGEGIIEDMNIRESGHILGGVYYFITLNNSKEYKVSEHSYYSVNIGDYVIIYKSERVEVIV